jgi:hypothetical protein
MLALASPPVGRCALLFGTGAWALIDFRRQKVLAQLRGSSTSLFLRS